MTQANRDDFSKATKDTLAKRVSYLCSNPECRRTTIGPNEIPTKSTSTGVAAHIAAASPGGPRYNVSISQEQRSSIENGIWLCEYCAALIDKDSTRFPVELLKLWKSQAEYESSQILKGAKPKKELQGPHIDIDFVLTTGGRNRISFSSKNPLSEENGIVFMDVSDNPICNWRFFQKFRLVIYNNSQHPAYNLALHDVGEVMFSRYAGFPNVNNLPPLEKVDVECEYEMLHECTVNEARGSNYPKIMERLNKAGLVLIYLDDSRAEHKIFIGFQDGKIVVENEK